MNAKINSVNNTIQYHESSTNNQQQRQHHQQQQQHHNQHLSENRPCQLMSSSSTNNHCFNRSSEQMSSPLPVIKPSELLLNPTPSNERSLVAVYCFVKNFIG